ncbi:helix-turn-helix transcriptional regulator [Nocardiopsis sediminis]|uniref:Helix-turn-helix transcriptional regulator n=1 Tax=Nocardiopsis sediminis TaxID=1778267 RepID=A0ABV8FNZ9_9ACTN
MMHSEAELSLFLKARRAALDPEQVAGLPRTLNRRRVRGLRREEVAQLAGVSVDYYTRIEQGRGGAVSAEVLGALSDALRLSDTERTYLRNLAGRNTRRSGASSADGVCAPPAMPRQRVRPELRTLLTAMERVPALIMGRALDLLAWNEPLARLWPGLELLGDDDLNLARLLFLDPQAAALHIDLDAMRREVVAKLRADSGADPDEPRLCGVVQDLRDGSPAFRGLWEEREVREQPHGIHRLRHPVAGELTLYFEKMPLPADPGQTLLTYAAEPGSPSEERLRLLVAAGQMV